MGGLCGSVVVREMYSHVDGADNGKKQVVAWWNWGAIHCNPQVE